MLKRKLFVLSMLMLMMNLGISQTWIRSFEEDGINQPFIENSSKAIFTQDNGILYLGNIPNGSGAKTVLTKFNFAGVQNWTTYIEESYSCYGKTIIETNDSAYIIAGGGKDSATSNDFLLVTKVDFNGNIIWQNRFGDVSIPEGGGNVLLHTDNNYYVLSSKSNTGLGVMRVINSDGIEVMPYHTFCANCQFTTFNFATDTSIILSGQYPSLTDSTKDTLIIAKYDHSFNELAVKKIEKNIDEYSDRAIIHNNDLLVLSNFDSDIVDSIQSFTYKLDEQLNLLWKKQIDANMYLFDVVYTNNNYLYSGMKIDTLPNGTPTALPSIAKTDFSGNVIDVYSNTLQGFSIYFGLDISQNYIAASGYANELNTPFVVKMDTSGNVNASKIEGNIFYDSNNDCNKDLTETNLSGIIVEAYNAVDSFITVTDSLGNYKFDVGIGSYQVEAQTNDLFPYSSCSSSPQFVSVPYDTSIIQVNIPLKTGIDCPFMYVDIAAAFVPDCEPFNYHVSYCNFGNQAVNDGYIEITFDTNLVVNSATLPWVSTTGRTYVFELDTLDFFDCGSFSVNVETNCTNTIISQSICTEAHIYPDSICINTAGWNLSQLNAFASCINDTVQIGIQNVGSGDSGGGLIINVIEDDILIAFGDTSLGAGDDTTIQILGNGSTYTVIMEQDDSHPFQTYTSASIEGCGVDDFGQFSTGFVNDFPLDEEAPYIAIDCQEIGDTAINGLKTVNPEGIGNTSIVSPNMDLEYKIVFRNTGLDTASSVYVIDTIAPELDLYSLQPGASSHPYTFNIYPPNILYFEFSNIMLPDSASHYLESSGFIQFTIGQQVNNSNGVEINNTADVYFDYGGPKSSNQTNSLIGLIPDSCIGCFQEVLIREIDALEGLSIYPNPVKEELLIDFQKFEELTNLQITLYDVQGKEIVHYVIRNMKQLESIKLPKLQSGIYFLQVLSSTNQSITTKLIVE